MALESLCDLSIRGKMLKPGPFDLEDVGVDFQAEMLGLHPEPQLLVQPPFVSRFIQKFILSESLKNFDRL